MIKKAPKRSKYGNRKTVLQGITFDSKAEATYYLVAKDFAARNGFELRLQERFELLPKHRRNGKAVRATHYIPDFTFWDGDQLVKVVDVKGMQTKDFKMKAKWFCYKYDIDLVLVDAKTMRETIF